MSLLTTPIFKNSRILAGVYFIFLKSVLEQTWKSFDTEFGPQWKDQEKSYQVKENLALFCTVVALILGWNYVKGLIVTKIVNKNQVWRSLEQVRSKKLFL